MPEYDERKCHEVAAVMSVLISRTLKKSKPSSIAEGLLMIALATGRVIHVLGALAGVDPKRICRDFCTSLTRYFDLGGDGHCTNELSRDFLSKGVAEDRTNRDNEHQGKFRYGILDREELKQRIEADARGVDYVVELTHCDELDREMEFRREFEKVNCIDTAMV